MVSRLKGFIIMLNTAAFSGVFVFSLEQTHFSLAAEIQRCILCNDIYLPSIKARTLHFTHIKKRKKYRPKRQIILNADYDLGLLVLFQTLPCFVAGGPSVV